MKLAIGTAQFGMNYGISNISGQVQQQSAQAILAHAASAGIDTIDTAMMYGNSELTLGNLGVDAFNVVTKLPEIPDNVSNVEGWVVRSVEDSISRLQVKNLYGVLLHNPDDLFESYGSAIMSGLLQLKSSGVVKKLGVSVYSPSELNALFEFYDFDIVQCPFNLIDRRLVNSGWLEKLKFTGVEVHTRSTFLQGLLLMSRDAIPSQFSAWEVLWNDWHRWLHINKVSPIEGCLSYCLSYSEIDRVIVGVDTQLQLTEIVRAIENVVINKYPAINSDDAALINPANWNAL